MKTRCVLSAATLLTALGCAPADLDGPEPERVGEAVQASTVAQAASSSCSTLSVKGLSEQIIAQGNCIHPGAYEKVPSLSNITFGAPVFRYLEKPAKNALVAALNAHPNTTLSVISMLRTVAQQFLLYQWDLSNTCGVPIAASPGTSNHETGLAMDVGSYSTWKAALEAKGFDWYGPDDSAHFTYVGGGAVDYKGNDVKAFQQLWNANHPGDKIAEDGDYGPQTEDRLKKSPAGGFPLGATCSADPDGDDDGIADAKDNCPADKNAGQVDTDGDGKGDACDADDDADGVADEKDNCRVTVNPDQEDTDGDGKGDACAADDDGDGVADADDDCPGVADPEQVDADGDGEGDACEDEGGPGTAGAGSGAGSGSSVGVEEGDAEVDSGCAVVRSAGGGAARYGLLILALALTIVCATARRQARRGSPTSSRDRSRRPRTARRGPWPRGRAPRAPPTCPRRDD